MAKLVHDDVLDGALNVIKNNCTRMVACSTQPTTYAEANATYALADVTMAAGDFVIADGDVSGRKLTVAAKSGVTVDATGLFGHVALLDVANSKLLFVTVEGNNPDQTLTAGNTCNFPAWKIEFADPS